MDLTKKQVGQAIYSLHQDSSKRYSWPELIELIFGKKMWQEIKMRYKLYQMKSMVGGIDSDEE
jgi:hypothetical protein